MIYVSEIYTTPPREFKTKLQEKVYSTLEELSISYERVDTNEAITMDDCVNIKEKLNTKIVKTLFLCNRQETNFYLYITTANKKFDCKKFSQELNISRTSFGKEELMIKLLNTKMGAATILSCLIDIESKVKIIIDKDVLQEEDYGCTDGTTTGYMKIKTSDVINKILPFSNHKEIIIEM